MLSARHSDSPRAGSLATQSLVAGRSQLVLALDDAPDELVHLVDCLEAIAEHSADYAALASRRVSRCARPRGTASSRRWVGAFALGRAASST